MLLNGAGRPTRRLLHLYAVDPGFDLANVPSLQPPDSSGFNRERRLQCSRDVRDRARGEAHVQSAAMASAAPLAGSYPQQQEFQYEGADLEAVATAPKTVTRVVSNGDFETFGTRLKAGRGFQPSDSGTAPPVVILSESMARYYFKDQNPISRRISWKLFNGNWSPKAEIVGIAADTRADGIEQTPLHTMYQPDAQTNAQSTLLVRTAGASDRITPRVIETIRSLDPNRPIDHVQTLEEIRDETIAPQRLNVTLIGLFAILALAIAMVGVAGVLAFSVSQRTNELGLRMALGAEPGGILRMILGEGAMMAAIG